MTDEVLSIRPSSRLASWLCWLAVVTLTSIAMVGFVDAPLAFYVHDHVVSIVPLQKPLPLTEILLPLALVVSLILAIGVLRGRLLGEALLCCAMAAWAVMWSETFVVAFKRLAGRTLPITSIPNTPSLLTNGTYGFFPLHSGAGWESFPSGHVAAIAAVIGVLWHLDNRFRIGGAILLALAAADTVLHNAHFLSDALAGGFIGFSSGWFTVVLYRAFENR
jgi:membrane-associated phospholipid phosphatase